MSSLPLKADQRTFMISREDILAYAFAQCRSNKGAPGIDGQDFAAAADEFSPPNLVAEKLPPRRLRACL
ncbi:hypothetical protein V1290_005422 [Bradyrhizobium sp. AZCC 1578]